ncbi:hypothetical protein GCM10011414_29500 [Croceivirga lutea]|uniref:carotenoid biosynthesis protein n=1 Tax=Croceivirga lutea TaxID=1775167 RepID=UPI00163B59BB|nr:carotenoid biosynthesis protein [Croceivirga lutea]GGG57803.1 hypothetical protein GCM10011414_29500 [Croceivirga lutea]
MQKNSSIRVNQFAIFLLWLFHISAIIGISIGYEDWFVSKTPLNLLVSALLFVFIYPINNLKKIGLLVTFFVIGMFVEWLGVNYSLLFGTYSYGNNLGIKVDGVPLFIGMYWALLTFVTAEIALLLTKNAWLKILTASLLMVVLDVFMEQLAPRFDFWSFGEIVPLSNYITWFAVALLLQTIVYYSKVTGNRTIAIHLYLVQLLFFIYFTIFFS